MIRELFYTQIAGSSTDCKSYPNKSNSDSLIEAGNFFGHDSTNESITVSGTYTSGITGLCRAQKLDASSWVLILKLPTTDTVNQTSLPYGTAETLYGRGYRLTRIEEFPSTEN